MATALRFNLPAPDVDDGWRDIIASAPPPPPQLPRDAFGATVPADVMQSGRHGCVASIQLAAHDERPSFDAGDRRMWLVAGALMTLATFVLGVLGVLTYKQSATTTAAIVAPAEPSATTSATQPVVARAASPSAASTASVVAERTPAIAPGAIGTARPLNQHALRHVVAKRTRKHRKLAAR